LPGLVTWVLAAIAIAVLDQYLEARFTGFYLYGINAAIAWPAVYVTIAAFFVRPEQRAAALSALLALAILVNLVVAGFGQLSVFMPPGLAMPSWWSSLEATFSLYGLCLVWLTGALFAVLRSFEPRAWYVQFPRAAALCVAI